ncbi:MAG: hypothetical protein LBC13_03630 [Clostridiales bacterium]|nr:hypothetical protein [Clostridiales bacterium]
MISQNILPHIQRESGRGIYGTGLRISPNTQITRIQRESGRGIYDAKARISQKRHLRRQGEDFPK